MGVLAVNGVHPGKVLLVGEAMTLFGAREEGDLAEVRDFIASTAGAELNVAVGLCRLGQQPVYMTRLGLDPFGERILGFMRNNDLDTSMVGHDEFRPTGIMFKSKVEHGDPVTFYCRAGSAASALSPIDIQSIDWQVVSVAAYDRHPASVERFDVPSFVCVGSCGTSARHICFVRPEPSTCIMARYRHHACYVA